MKPSGSILAPKLVPKWLLEASGALLGAKWAPGGSPGGCQNAPEAPRGRKKKNFTLPGGPGGRFGLHFGRPWGLFWPSFWRLVSKIRKSQILQTVHTKTLLLRVPGGSRAPFLEPKIVTKTTWKPRARTSPLRESRNRFWSALGEPPGPKNNFGKCQKRARGILERFFKNYFVRRGLRWA